MPKKIRCVKEAWATDWFDADLSRAQRAVFANLDVIQSRGFVKALLNPTPSSPKQLRKALAAYRRKIG